MTEYISKINNYPIGGEQFDGAWIVKDIWLAAAFTLSDGGTKTFDISSYIPSDGFDYEITLGIYNNNAGSNNQTQEIWLCQGSSSPSRYNTGSYPISMCTKPNVSGNSSSAGNTNMPIYASKEKKITLLNYGAASGNMRLILNAIKRLGNNDNLSNRIEKINIPSRQYTIPNGNIVGDDLINSNGIISGFSSTSYIELSNTIKSNNNIEISIKFTTGSDITTTQRIFHDEKFVQLEITNGNVYAYNWGASTITNLIAATANTTYWFKVIVNGTTKTYSYSTDGTTYTQVTSYSDSGMDRTRTEVLTIGNSSFVSGRMGYFLGSIDFNDTYIKDLSNNTLIYEGITTETVSQEPLGGKVNDGPWVKVNANLFTNTQITGGGGTKTVSLSSYLPNDGNVYEVQLKVYGTTGSTSGNMVEIVAHSGNFKDYYVSRNVTRYSSNVRVANNVTIPIANREITFQNNGSTATNSISAVLLKYKRVAVPTEGNYVSKINDKPIGGDSFNGNWVEFSCIVDAETDYENTSSSGVTKNYELIGYLPNNDNDNMYEVLYYSETRLYNQNGKGTSVTLSDSITNNIQASYSIARSAYNTDSGVTGKLVLKQNNNRITLPVWYSSGTKAWVIYYRLLAYRRIGTAGTL